MTTVDEDSRSVVLDLPVEPTTVMSALRGDLTASLQDLGEDHRYDVLLVVTELVTNVLDHTSGFGRLRVVRSRAECEVTVEVDDASELQPVHGQPRLGDARGRGIVVIANLARQWGVRLLSNGGKTVFASVACASDGTAAGWCTAVE